MWGSKYSYKDLPKDFSGKFGEIRAKIFRIPKNLPTPTLMANNKNCVYGGIQSASHILYYCTVPALPCSNANTTNEDLIEYFAIVPFRSYRIVLPPVSCVYNRRNR